MNTDCIISAKIALRLSKDGISMTAKGKRIMKRECESMAAIDEFAGLWCDDITFCQENCGWVKSCPRNKKNIRDKTIPHSFSVEIPADCPKAEKAKKANGNS